MNTTAFNCTQCSSSDFKKENDNHLRCTYCLSLYAIEKPKGSGVIINKGANVTFGESANVIISGGLEIEEGANVEINGKITLIEKSNSEKIEEAITRLKKI